MEEKALSPDEVNEMEERRLEMLDKAGIDERTVLGRAKEDEHAWNSYFSENITRGKDDVNFTIRDQWSAIERSEFTRLFKPAMTFNKLYDNVKKVAGEQRKNKPDLLVRSLTGKATQEQINLRADLVRTISYRSQNDLVYQTAFRSALMMGYGAFEVDVDYENPHSFNQEIIYRLIPDATRTGFDPTATKPHKGDGNSCWRIYTLSRDEFNATYPFIINPVSYTDPDMMINWDWQRKDNVVLCDYSAKEWFPVIIHKLSNGMVVTDDKWEEMQKTFQIKKEIADGAVVVGGIILNEIPKIVATRQTQDYIIRKYRLLQNQIVDFSDWPSRQLPIIFVDGDSYWVEGRQYTKSFIHEARDAQKCVNYFGSEIAADVKNRRREQWIGTPDNIIGYEQQWRNPELQMGILLAKPDPKTGMLPQKSPPWELSQGLLQNFQRSSQDIREILGFSETEALQGRDISGRARRERKMEGSMSAYVYFDNLNQAIEQAGRVVLDLLPVVYGGEERHVIITQKDGNTKSLVLNKELPNGEIENELAAGDYDIEIDTGPSFAVQKDIALEFFQQTIANSPQVFPLIADLWAKNLDVQFMPQIAERLQTLVPPQILAKEKGEAPPPPPPPSPQEMMIQQEMQNRQQEIIERAEELRLRKEKHELEKAELILKAKKLSDEMGIDERRLTNEMEKAEMDFVSKISKVLADVHTKSSTSAISSS